MATAMRLAGDEEEKGKGGKGNCDGNEARLWGEKMVRGARAMAKATRVAGERWQWQCRGQGNKDGG